jgi:hypothetical protein
MRAAYTRIWTDADGETHVLLEDTSGAGHRTRVPDGAGWLAMVVVLD